MNTTGALIYLVSTLTDLYVTAILLRLLLQWVRADFYNPLSQFLVKVTNPILVPARRLIPSIGKLDTASVVVMLLLELLQLVVIGLLSQTDFGFQFLLVFAVRKLLIALLLTYFVLIIARVIVSWIASQSRHPLIPLIYQLTEPVLRPINKLLPTMGGVDLSPLFALIALRALLLLLGW
ncbi:MAG: YggT family protein [Xanthomonadales bacterium]|nr:YggT family protein [Xanthomonadales bacterium]